MKYIVTYLIIFIGLVGCNEEESKEMEKPIESVITEQDLNYLNNLPSEILADIDSNLYSHTSEHWQKVAMILSKSNKDLKGKVPILSYEQLLSRLHFLIKSGKLTSQGNINIMRFSEVKRT